MTAWRIEPSATYRWGVAIYKPSCDSFVVQCWHKTRKAARAYGAALRDPHAICQYTMPLLRSTP